MSDKMKAKMTLREKDDLLLKKASRAMRSAIRKVVADRKMRGQPLIVWQNGGVVYLDPNDVK